MSHAYRCVNIQMGTSPWSILFMVHNCRSTLEIIILFLQLRTYLKSAEVRETSLFALWFNLGPYGRLDRRVILIFVVCNEWNLRHLRVQWISLLNFLLPDSITCILRKNGKSKIRWNEQVLESVTTNSGFLQLQFVPEIFFVTYFTCFRIVLNCL